MFRSMQFLAAAAVMAFVAQPLSVQARGAMPDVIEAKRTPPTFPCGVRPCGPNGPKCLAKPCGPIGWPGPRKPL